MAMGTDNTFVQIIDEGSYTEEQLTKEQTEAYLAALVREKAGLEQRVSQLTHEDAPKDTKPEDIERAKADLDAVKAELARITDGVGGEPRAKQRK